MSFIQYLKDTRGELHHVAWPTRVQTIVFTILVIAISILTSLYLGLFDYIFTTGLSEVVQMLPNAQDVQIETVPATTTDTTPPPTLPLLDGSIPSSNQ